MKTLNAIKQLTILDNQGSSLFSRNELGSIFSESGDTLASTIKRLVKTYFLVKVANGLYANKNAKPDENRLYKIAAKLRYGSVNYLSNESVLCNLSIISQQMLDRITVMTTGRSATFKTPYGVIEFTHTKRRPMDIIKGTTKIKGVPILFADKHTAVRDLKRIGRNVDMIDWEEFEAS